GEDEYQRQRQQWNRPHPELGPEELTHLQRARAQQPQRAALQADPREDETRRDRRQNKPRQNQVHERDDVGQEEGDTFAAQRQELDVEDVHHHQHGEENQL